MRLVVQSAFVNSTYTRYLYVAGNLKGNATSIFYNEILTKIKNCPYTVLTFV